MARIVWTKPALADLDDILAYISRDSAVYAQRFGERLVASVSKLEDFPRVGRIPPEFEGLAEREVRQLIFESYRIIYEVRGIECFIASIIHASRDVLRHVDPAEWDF